MDGLTGARDARAEAAARLGGRYRVGVLEPSPPAVRDEPWLADDPPDAGPADGRPAVTPVPGGDAAWDDLAREDPDALGAWCRERWLGAWATLAPAPPRLAETRGDLHRLALYAVAAARKADRGKFGLRWTLGGFGTPFFGADDRQVRVVGGDLVVQRAGSATVSAITTLAAAAATTGVPLDREADGAFDAPRLGSATDPLTVDAAASRWLGDWYGFAAGVLEVLRAEASDGVATRAQIWPEHFDLAIELGDAATGGRASLGASPGDAVHPLPYLYVAPWGEVPDDAFFSASGFRGAELGLEELRRAPDARAHALDFFRAGMGLLSRREAP